MLSVVRVPDYDAAVSLISNMNTAAPPSLPGRGHRPLGGGIRWVGGGQCADSGSHGLSLLRGLKRSLFGPLHMHGPDGVRFFTRMKTITSRWPTGIRQNPDFNMPTL